MYPGHDIVTKSVLQMSNYVLLTESIQYEDLVVFILKELCFTNNELEKMCKLSLLCAKN